MMKNVKMTLAAAMAAFLVAGSVQAQDMCTDDLEDALYSCTIPFQGDDLLSCLTFDEMVNATTGLIEAEMDFGPLGTLDLVCGCGAEDPEKDLRCSGISGTSTSVLVGEVSPDGDEIEGDILGTTSGNAVLFTCEIDANCVPPT